MPNYACWEDVTEHVSNNGFYLHAHDEYEILLFLSGNSQYVIEDKVYSLEKGDMIIVRKHEMHRIFHLETAIYHRIVLMISPDFFQTKGCMEYEAVFHASKPTIPNKIDGKIVHTSGLYDAIMRLKKYSDSFFKLDSPISESILVEILYLLNKAVTFSHPETNHSQMKQILSWINTHYTEKITLDMLSERFYISKYHLCRLFRQSTGHTVMSYLQNKRLIYAEDLIQNGYTKTEAASLAGFSDYSAFHRASKKNTIPRKYIF